MSYIKKSAFFCILSLFLLTLSSCSVKNSVKTSGNTSSSETMAKNQDIQKIELNDENWNNYFEIREENIPGYDKFGDLSGFAHMYSLCIKKDVQISDPNIYDFEITVEYSSTISHPTIEYDCSNQTFSIIDDGDEQRTTINQTSISAYGYIHNNSEYIVEDGYTKNYHKNGHLKVLEYDTFKNGGNSPTERDFYTDVHITRVTGNLNIINN